MEVESGVRRRIQEGKGGRFFLSGFLNRQLEV